jgi:hypothetical protein
VQIPPIAGGCELLLRSANPSHCKSRTNPAFTGCGEKKLPTLPSITRKRFVLSLCSSTTPAFASSSPQFPPPPPWVGESRLRGSSTGRGVGSPERPPSPADLAWAGATQACKLHPGLRLQPWRARGGRRCRSSLAPPRSPLLPLP